MNFYEELGVPPDATPETIRDAYRHAARLLHPDVQTDSSLKESAEARMKRINHLYGILSHPERRRRYDRELECTAERRVPMVVETPPANHGTLVWLAAAAICAAFILWLAARESSSSPAVYPPPAPAARTTAGARTSIRAKSPVSTATLPAKPDGQPRDEQLAALRGQLLAANADRERLDRQAPASPQDLTPAPIVVPQTSPNVLPPPPLPRIEPPPPAAAEAINWTGSWEYQPVRAGNRDKELFPPEFIETTITEEKGRIRGRYRARFKIAGASISPDVDFRFQGQVSGASARLPWNGAGGAKGEVQLRLVSGTALEVVWSATSLGKSMGLASGTAVLDREN